jgi:hypothetical protein
MVQQPVSLIDIFIIVIPFSQVPTNRPGPLITRTVTPNQNFPYPVIGSPSLSSKPSHTDNLPLSSRNSPTSYTFSPATNSYTPPTTTQLILSQGIIHDSPSISIRSLPNQNVPHPPNQSPLGVKTDSNSLRSEDSTTSSEDPLHSTLVPQSNSIRNQDTPSPNLRYRPPQAYPSTSQAGNLITHLTNTTSSSTGTTSSSVAGVPPDRVPSPSPSLLSEREREENERIERELESKRKRLQIYVFICRCIACPFNSKQSSDMARKHLKITLVQYGVIKERFLGFLNGKTHIEADEGKRFFSSKKNSIQFSFQLL